MPDLNVTKILVVLVVALVVLGPDKLPKAARQAAGFYNDLRRFRDSFNNEVREAFGDLGTVSTLPARGRTWARSVTTDALKMTSPAAALAPPQGTQPVGAASASGRPPDGRAVEADPGAKATPGTTQVPGPGGHDEGELDLTFN